MSVSDHTQLGQTPDHLERLIGSLLYEGYALYPYTPGASKNSTPTPFGIVYPTAYADTQAAAFDRMQLQCVVEDALAPVTAEVRFLLASGERHQGVEQRVTLDRAPSAVDFEFGGVRGRAVLELQPLPRQPGEATQRGRVTVRVENTTPLTDEEVRADRKALLLRSLLSTHLVARVEGSRFISPLERGDDGVAGCCQVNTWPVLATPGDDAVLGPTIMLPDHPQIAPESVCDFFDGTEIEEALVLHIQALSDDEREAIAQQDPKVREMLARADATTPEQLMDLHGRVRIQDSPGEKLAMVGGAPLRPGDKVILRPGESADVYDKLVAGQTATVHRLFIDYDARLHIGVTIDNDPMSEIFSETGRFQYFFENEVEHA